jgi:hypothetical protein
VDDIIALMSPDVDRLSSSKTSLMAEVREGEMGAGLRRGLL